MKIFKLALSIIFLSTIFFESNDDGDVIDDYDVIVFRRIGNFPIFH